MILLCVIFLITNHQLSVCKNFWDVILLCVLYIIFDNQPTTTSQHGRIHFITCNIFDNKPPVVSMLKVSDHNTQHFYFWFSYWMVEEQQFIYHKCVIPNERASIIFANNNSSIPYLPIRRFCGSSVMQLLCFWRFSFPIIVPAISWNFISSMEVKHNMNPISRINRQFSSSNIFSSWPKRKPERKDVVIMLCSRWLLMSCWAQT